MTEESTPSTPEQGASGEQPQIQFAVQRIYVKDVSFEAPNGLAPAQTWQPKVSQDLNTQVNKVQDDLYEVVLKITVTVTVDDKTAFLVEVHQAGLFGIKGPEGPQLQHLLSSQCPHILFPYARECIDSLCVRGGFPPLMLPPINFDALFAQAVSEARKRAEEKPADDSAH